MKNIQSYIDQIESMTSDKELDAFFSCVLASPLYSSIGMQVFQPVSATQVVTTCFGELPDCIQERGSLHSELVSYSSYGHKAKLFKTCDGEAANCLIVLPVQSRGTSHGTIVFEVMPEHMGEDKLSRLEWFWSILAPYLFAKALGFSNAFSTRFTNRESECITWASEGKTSWEISRILNISESTVNFHLSNFVKKSQSVNRQQAIAKYLLQWGSIAV